MNIGERLKGAPVKAKEEIGLGAKDKKAQKKIKTLGACI